MRAMRLDDLGEEYDEPDELVADSISELTEQLDAAVARSDAA